MSQTHGAHAFTRLVSEAADGRAVYGCSYGRCAETEVRAKGSKSPFAEKLTATRTKKRGVPA